MTKQKNTAFLLKLYEDLPLKFDSCLCCIVLSIISCRKYNVVTSSFNSVTGKYYRGSLLSVLMQTKLHKNSEEAGTVVVIAQLMLRNIFCLKV